LQGIKLSYVYYYRKRYNYSGHLFQDRFKSILVQKDIYLLSCGAYIELNPVRAGIVKTTEEYPYSSCRYYTCGERNLLIDPDPFYLGLGKTEGTRAKQYKVFIEGQLSRDVNYSRGNYIGSEKFEKKIKDEYEVEKVSPKRGRPRKAS
jgi:putative transposase